MELIDTHTHLAEPVYDPDREKVVSRATESGIKHILVIGCEETEWDKTLNLKNAYPFLKPCFGLHPHYVDKTAAETLTSWIKENTKPENITAIGEIGLDYFRNLSPTEKQRTTFAKLIEFGKILDLPLIIHCRDAYDDVYAILKEQQTGIRGVVHCFSADLGWADKFIQLGLFLGITGSLTYPKTDKLKQVVKETPLTKLLLETDCPYLPPQSWRGKRNEPQYLIAVAEEMAKIKNISVEEVAAATTTNAKGLFRI